MSALLSLRDYQREALDAIVSSPDRRRAVVLPTGSGKTVVFAHLTSDYRARNPGKRVIVLVHTDELVQQAYQKIHDIAPHLSVGIVKAERNQVRSDVIVASVQSLRNVKRRSAIRDVGLVIVDECHRGAAKTYVDVLTHFGCYEDKADAVGFTATLTRGDSRSLGDVWESVSYSLDISTMIRRGYLLDVRGKRVEVDDLDLAKVRKSGGDYQAGDLGEAMTASLAPEIVAKAYVEHASNRSGILFAPTVNAAEVFASEMNLQGIVTEVVHGGLTGRDRRAILRRLESGDTQIVSNCMVLTEGFDSPRVSCVVVARPTRSSGLYQQMVGRALRVDLTRPRVGQDALILDVVGASRTHGLASLIDLSPKKLIEFDEEMSLIDAEDLLEAAEREAADLPELDPYYGPATVVDFDPLAASRVVWMKTERGTHFLSAGTESDAIYVFVMRVPTAACHCTGECEAGTSVSDDDAHTGNFTACANGSHGIVECTDCDVVDKYSVAWCTKDVRRQVDGSRGGVTEHVNLDLNLALAWGEDVVNEASPAGHLLTTSKTSSWRKGKPSDSQLNLCRNLGIEVPEGARRGDVSTLIDTRMASKRIDPIVHHFASQG